MIDVLRDADVRGPRHLAKRVKPEIDQYEETNRRLRTHEYRVAALAIAIAIRVHDRDDARARHDGAGAANITADLGQLYAALDPVRALLENELADLPVWRTRNAEETLFSTPVKREPTRRDWRLSDGKHHPFDDSRSEAPKK